MVQVFAAGNGDGEKNAPVPIFLFRVSPCLSVSSVVQGCKERREAREAG